MATTWRDLILDQLDFYWQHHFMPRLRGLSDHEYLWEPVEGAWSLRAQEDGTVDLESVVPEPPVPPVTTIAWRIGHLGRDVLGKRARCFFGGSEAPAEADMFDERHWPEPLPLSAAGGIALLEEGYTLWRGGIATLEDEALLQPIGAKGGPFAEDSMAALAMHLNRETMAHGAEIYLLRDLYRVQVLQDDPLVRAAYAGTGEEVRSWFDRRGGLGNLAAREPSLLADVVALRHWEVARDLIAQGFPAMNPAETGVTALHYAAAAGKWELVDRLIAHGADVSASEASFGFDPAAWADHFGHADLAAHLRSLKG